MKPSYQTAIWENNTNWKPKQTAWNNWDNKVEERISYLEDLAEYFEFETANYVEKIQALNTYTKKGYSVDAFIKAVSPFNANTLLNDLKRFSHTQFYKDMKSYIDIFKLGYDEL
jgi:hypothetical protein